MTEPRRIPTIAPLPPPPQPGEDLHAWAARFTAATAAMYRRIAGAEIVTMERVSDGALLKRSGSTVVDGAGGSGSPGGSNTQVQFNDAGAFGGDAGLVYDKTLDNLTIGSTGIIPRLGPASTATTGGAIRIVDGVKFPLTVAGVQAALDECEAAGGGTVLVPANAGILIATTSIKIGNRVKLVGLGDHHAAYTFTCNASTNVAAVVENKTQDGTQQYAYADNISIFGNKASGALVTRGLNFKSVYAGSKIRDVLVDQCSGNGAVLDGGASAGLGQMVVENLTVANCNDHNILLTGPCDSVWMFGITSEGQAAGKAALRITTAGAGTASTRHCIFGFHSETTAAADCIVLDTCSSVLIDGAAYDGGAANSLVKITGATGGSDGAFAAAGHTIRNAQANIATIIDDQVAGVTIGNAQGRFVRLYQSPVASDTLDKAQTIGLQEQRQGVNLASATTITPENGSYFDVTGTTPISTVTANARYKGKIAILHFTSTAALNTGGNVILLHGSFVGPADRVIALECDGINWREIARNAPLIETGGPTLLTMGAVADGQLLTRSGTMITGSTGGGPAGPIGPIGLTGEDGADGAMGPPGPSGNAGSTGPQGPTGPAVFLEAEALDGEPGPPGVAGSTGPAGSPGAQGPTGPAVYLEAEAGDEGLIGPPGPPGPQGVAGAGGTLTLTDITQDLGVAYRSGTFDVFVLSATPGKNVVVMQTAKAIASKGNARDEGEMDQIQATGYVVDANTLRVYWQAPSVVVGTYAFAYAVSS